MVWNWCLVVQWRMQLWNFCRSGRRSCSLCQCRRCSRRSFFDLATLRLSDLFSELPQLLLRATSFLQLDLQLDLRSAV